ncbi:MAG: uroporphyrinogen decarboxylase family protein [Thermodesulfovibrionales bacterium]|jgi:[methyl-Co(III) methanol-specific corrinoid protein]:coenzyme M methyltransferase
MPKQKEKSGKITNQMEKKGVDMTGLTPRERVLKFLNGEKVDRPPIFSGMGNVIKPVLDKYGIVFSRVHRDPELMARAAAGMYREFGYECAVVPFDLGVEAEALGAKMNFYDEVEGLLYPTVKEKSVKDVSDVHIPEDLEHAGRIPVVTGAIRALRRELGSDVAIGAYVLGPFTLAGQVEELDALFEESFLEPEKTDKLLRKLSDFIIRVFKIYRDAGADYFTLREMGGTSDVMSPKSFKTLIKPHLVRILAEMPHPSILHICGDTNTIITDMAECGADAVSVDQKNCMAETRQKLGTEAIILGNFDPIKVLHKGVPKDVGPAVLAALKGGASAVWPGCDLWPEVSKENMEALMAALKGA